MFWVFFQVLLAFGVAVFIVWWTFPRNEKAPADGTPAAGEPNEPGEK